MKVRRTRGLGQLLGTDLSPLEEPGTGLNNGSLCSPKEARKKGKEVGTGLTGGAAQPWQLYPSRGLGLGNSRNPEEPSPRPKTERTPQEVKGRGRDGGATQQLPRCQSSQLSSLQLTQLEPGAREDQGGGVPGGASESCRQLLPFFLPHQVPSLGQWPSFPWSPHFPPHLGSAPACLPALR